MEMRWKKPAERVAYGETHLKTKSHFHRLIARSHSKKIWRIGMAVVASRFQGDPFRFCLPIKKLGLFVYTEYIGIHGYMSSDF